jgi:hypothetical protein
MELQLHLLKHLRRSPKASPHHPTKHSKSDTVTLYIPEDFFRKLLQSEVNWTCCRLHLKYLLYSAVELMHRKVVWAIEVGCKQLVT